MWKAHVKRTAAKHKGKPLKFILKEASRTYKPQKQKPAQKGKGSLLETLRTAPRPVQRLIKSHGKEKIIKIKVNILTNESAKTI